MNHESKDAAKMNCLSKYGTTDCQQKKFSTLSFQSYLEDLNSSTSCCRSVSLLVPTAPYNSDTSQLDAQVGLTPNEILTQLRQWEWVCEFVLIHPWRNPSDKNYKQPPSLADPWYFECLPTEDELLFLCDKYPISFALHDEDKQLPESLGSDSSKFPPLQKKLVKYHIKSKSLLVPLTDDGTAIILQFLFGIHGFAGQDESQYRRCSDRCVLDKRKSQPTTNINEMKSGTLGKQQIGDTKSANDIEEYCVKEILAKNQERLSILQKWFEKFGIMIVHNSDGNQTVSLSKEVDVFPSSVLTPPPFTNANAQRSSYESDGSHFTFVDLFAGIGGFRIGMEALGGKCIGSCEIDAYARMTYVRNFLKGNDRRHSQESSKTEEVDQHHDKGNAEFFVNDIARLDIPPEVAPDVLCGGFPCQSFSTLAATNKTSPDTSSSESNHQNGQGGLFTPRKGKLFFHLIRILRRSKPKLFVFENVKGLMNLENGRHFRKVIRLLEESGYHVTHGLVETSWFLPQRRERVYFVGVRLDLFENSGVSTNDFVAFTSEELKRRYQIYQNDIPGGTSCNKFDRALQNHGYNGSSVLQEGEVPTSPLSNYRLGDILESNESLALEDYHCFLSPFQWHKVQGQNYTQLHNDGSGQLLTENDHCAQTLVSSYRKSFLMHSQFVVPCDSVFLVRQKAILISEAMKMKHTVVEPEIPTLDPINDSNRETLSHFSTPRSVHLADEASTGCGESDHTMPRFFTPRECCRLQGFPEQFLLPFKNGEKRSSKQHRQLVSHFYRQIGNAVSPPCVAAVSTFAVSTFLQSKRCSERRAGNGVSLQALSRINKVFDTNPTQKESSDKILNCDLCVVWNLVVQASPVPEKVLEAIERKFNFKD